LAYPNGRSTLIPGQFFYEVPGQPFFHRTVPPPGVPVVGTLDIFLTNRNRRNSYYGLTGTYYEKEWTDIVYRYNTLYTNNFGVNVGSKGEWAEQVRTIMASDRPSYIPWLSKQHTFFTAQ